MLTYILRRILTMIPTLLVISERCPNFCREMKGFKKKTTRVGGKDVVTDEGNRKGMVHTCEVAEYGAAHGLAYVAPPKRRVHRTIFDFIMDGEKDRAKVRAGKKHGQARDHISFGPQGSNPE